MKTKALSKLFMYFMLILLIFFIDRMIDLTQLMPAFLLIIGMIITAVFFKRFGKKLQSVWRIVPCVSLSVYAVFVIILYVTIFHYNHWEHEAWFTRFSTIALIIYIVTFLPLLGIVSFDESALRVYRKS